MDAGSIWGMLIFTAVVSAAVGAAAHKWLFARAHEVEATLNKAAHDASAKIEQFKKDL